MINLDKYRLPPATGPTREDRVARKYTLSTDAVEMLEQMSDYLNRNLSDTLEILIREAYTANAARLSGDDEPPAPGFNLDDLET